MASSFRVWDGFVQDVLLADYPGLEDSWLEIIGSQGESLLALDISSSTVSDEGLALLETCTNLQSLILNSCEYISDEGLPALSGILRTACFSHHSAYTLFPVELR